VGGGETETQNSKREIWRERLREKSEEMPVVVNTMRSGSHTHLVRFFSVKIIAYRFRFSVNSVVIVNLQTRHELPAHARSGLEASCAVPHTLGPGQERERPRSPSASTSTLLSLRNVAATECGAKAAPADAVRLGGGGDALQELPYEPAASTFITYSAGVKVCYERRPES